MEYDRHILNSNNVMRTSLLNKKVGKDHKNHAIQSVNIDGTCTGNRQIGAEAFNNHITTFHDMFNKNIMHITLLLKPLSIIRISFPIFETCIPKFVP